VDVAAPSALLLRGRDGRLALVLGSNVAEIGVLDYEPIPIAVILTRGNLRLALLQDVAYPAVNERPVHLAHPLFYECAVIMSEVGNAALLGVELGRQLIDFRLLLGSEDLFFILSGVVQCESDVATDLLRLLDRTVILTEDRRAIRIGGSSDLSMVWSSPVWPLSVGCEHDAESVVFEVFEAVG
jgi:hypothetical protein